MLRCFFAAVALVVAAHLVVIPELIAQDNSAASQIDAIVANDQVIIGDQSYRISSNAVFYAADERTQLRFSDFEEGDLVEFSVNSDGEIDEMWRSSE